MLHQEESMYGFNIPFLYTSTADMFSEHSSSLEIVQSFLCHGVHHDLVHFSHHCWRFPSRLWRTLPGTKWRTNNKHPTVLIWSLSTKQNKKDNQLLLHCHHI